MTILSFKFNADGLISKLEQLQRDYQAAPAILQAAHEELALMTAERAAALLEQSEVGRPSARTGRLEEAIVDPSDYRATPTGFQLGIEEFLEASTRRGSHQGYWRMIEFTGVQAFDTEAAFTENYDRSGPYTRPGEGSGQPFMPQFSGAAALEQFSTDRRFGAFSADSVTRQVHIASRSAYHPFERAAASLTAGEVFEVYRAAFARRGISLTSTNLGNRGIYVNGDRITA